MVALVPHPRHIFNSKRSRSPFLEKYEIIRGSLSTIYPGQRTVTTMLVLVCFRN